MPTQGAEPKTNRRELWAWALYDPANNGFATLVQTFVFATYFTTAVAPDPASGAAAWGLTLSLAGLAVALLGPLLGAATDRAGRRKPPLALLTLLCVAATYGLFSITPEPENVLPALVLVALGTIGSELAVVFYNAMLPALVPVERIGRWSGWGWALGYAGGLVCLALSFLLFLGDSPLVGGLGLPAGGVRLTLLLSASWYLLLALPLFFVTPDTPATGLGYGQAMREGLGQLLASARQVREHRQILRFLIARMLYNDGLTTTFAFGGIYAASTFGLSQSEVLLFGIGLNVTAGLGAFAFGWVDDFLGPKPTILISLVFMILFGTFILVTTSTTAFLVACLALGIFFGPVQSASRSYLARTAPPELRNQFFGLFALSGKLISFLGPFLVATFTELSGSQRVGLSPVILMFSLGALVLLSTPRAKPETVR